MVSMFLQNRKEDETEKNDYLKEKNFHDDFQLSFQKNAGKLRENKKMSLKTVEKVKIQISEPY